MFPRHFQYYGHLLQPRYDAEMAYAAGRKWRRFIYFSAEAILPARCWPLEYFLSFGRWLLFPAEGTFRRDDASKSQAVIDTWPLYAYFLTSAAAAADGYGMPFTRPILRRRWHKTYQGCLRILRQHCPAPNIALAQALAHINISPRHARIPQEAIFQHFVDVNTQPRYADMRLAGHVIGMSRIISGRIARTTAEMSAASPPRCAPNSPPTHSKLDDEAAHFAQARRRRIFRPRHHYLYGGRSQLVRRSNFVHSHNGSMPEFTFISLPLVRSLFRRYMQALKSPPHTSCLADELTLTCAALLSI